VYSLGLDSIDTPDPLAAAEPTMLRFLVNDGLRYAATAEISMDEMSDAEPVPDLSTGSSAAEMANFVRSAEVLEGPDAIFEVRLLRAPAIQLAALWLHSEEDEDIDHFWLIGEQQSSEETQALDRDAMTAELRRRATFWTSLYAEAQDGEDPSLLGG
jgi:hypothetical protein